MYAYLKKYKTSEICLLCPENEEMKQEKDISYESEDNVTVKLFFIDVANIAEVINLRTLLVWENGDRVKVVCEK